MGKNKLKKFDEMKHFRFVFEYPWARLQQEPFPLKGGWRDFFGSQAPLTVELGCGKGEYTVGLARRFPTQQFVGIDVKGARMWTGAKQVEQEQLDNAAFLRGDIDTLDAFFAPAEVNALWITFPDPQMQKPRKRLTGTRMLEIYRKVLAADGRVNLKTDSPFLYAYTKLMCQANGLAIFHDCDDIYGSDPTDEMPEGLTSIRTHYEQQWLDRGLTIKFLSFSPFNGKELVEPEGGEELDKDTYRSYSRGYIQMPQLLAGEDQ